MNNSLPVTCLNYHQGVTGEAKRDRGRPDLCRDHEDGTMFEKGARGDGHTGHLTSCPGGTTLKI